MFKDIEEFNDFLREIDGTIEYYFLSQEKSGLPCDIYLDDCRSYQRYEHPLFALCCDGESHNDTLVPILVSDNPCLFIDKYNFQKLSLEQFNKVKEFIKYNLFILRDLSNEKVDSISIIDRLVKV